MGGWLIVTAVVYSFMSGTIHPYYTNTLAPAIAVLTGVGATLLWQRRERLIARMTLAAMLAATGVWALRCLTGHRVGTRGCAASCSSAR